MTPVLGPVAEQISAAETAILTAITAHPDRHGALLTHGCTVREVHRADWLWIETGAWSTAQLLDAAEQATAWGDTVTASAYREVLKGWTP